VYVSDTGVVGEKLDQIVFPLSTSESFLSHSEFTAVLLNR
jgi:hypothetical protein